MKAAEESGATVRKALPSSEICPDENQQALIHSTAFKQWFGDWQDDPPPPAPLSPYAKTWIVTGGPPSPVSRMRENATGEPMEVYHGTSREFEWFDLDAPCRHDAGYYGRGVYFCFGWGEGSAKEAEYYGARVLRAFLKVRQPFDLASLSTFAGCLIRELGSETLVFLYQVARLFPEIAGEVFDHVNLCKDGRRIRAEELIGLVDSMPDRLTVIDVRETGGSINPYVFLDTGTCSPRDLSRRLRRVQDHETEAEALAKAVFQAVIHHHDIHPDLYPEGVMTRNPCISRALRARGYDAILQTPSGDEVVVFDPSQIWIAQ